MVRINTNDRKKQDLDWLDLFHQKRKQVISFTRTLICYRHFAMDFIFSTNLYRYQIVLKYIQSNIESWLKKQFKCLIMEDCLSLQWMFTSWKWSETTRNETRCYSRNVLSVYCWHAIFFEFIREMHIHV